MNMGLPLASWFDVGDVQSLPGVDLIDVLIIRRLRFAVARILFRSAGWMQS